jgi:5-methylcytosine-specific restriction endonuclease McrA
MKPKKPKLDNVRKRLQKEAENLWKLACKTRDDFKCVLCGSTEILQVHHVFSRKNKGLFLDVANGLTLCRRHHMLVTWDDGAKEFVRRHMIAKDKDTYDRLYEQSLFKGTFLEFKDIQWLTEQISFLSSLTNK